MTMTGQVWISEFVVDTGRIIVYTSYCPTEIFLLILVEI
jgi:hypothetical protein